MKSKELATLTDEELLAASKETKLTPIVNALFIGFLFGIVFYSIAKNTWGFFTLIPLVMAYILIKNSKRNKELERILKERKLS